MDLMDIGIGLILVLFSLSVHEFAHAWAAFRFGDDTAALQGRMTLHPAAHIDPFGTIILPILLLLTPGHFLFGYAKPVPVNPFRVRNPSVGMPLIAAAGPASNIVQMLFGCILFSLCAHVFRIPNFGGWDLLYSILKDYIMINYALALFNLIPVSPLDGGKVITLFMSDNTARKYENALGRLDFIPFLVLIVVNSFTGGFILNMWFSLWSPVFNPIFRLFGVFSI